MEYTTLTLILTSTKGIPVHLPIDEIIFMTNTKDKKGIVFTNSMGIINVLQTPKEILGFLDSALEPGALPSES